MGSIGHLEALYDFQVIMKFMRLSVLIPTWKRGELLQKCLKSLTIQERQPDEVVVIYRDEDPEAQKYISEFAELLPLVRVMVDEPGVIHAENKGIDQASGEIICFLDDDAEAPAHWLKIIEEHYKRDSSLAGVGGPDFIANDGDYRRECNTVGKLTWYGKVIGNHHHKISKLQEVDVLKGVNMSFRKSHLMPLDPLLHSQHSYGNGSQWELDLCMQIKNKGGQLIFDPALDLIHNSNHSHIVKLPNIRNNAHNLVYVLLKNLPAWKKISFLIYLIFIGNNQIVGFAKLIHMLIKQEDQVMPVYWNSLKGSFAGVLTYLKN